MTALRNVEVLPINGSIKLQATCIDTWYERVEYSQEERESFQRTISNNAVKMSEIDEEKKAFAEIMKVKVDPLKKSTKTAIQELRRGFEEVKREVYGLPNFDEGKMEFYTEDGTMIDNLTRRLRPEEKQTFIGR